MYHRVAPRQLPGHESDTVTTRAFAAQMRWIATAGYNAVSLDAVWANRTAGTPLPRRPMVITFDDGYQDCADNAVPILLSHGFSATFFLVAGLMGQRSNWFKAVRGYDVRLMSWAAARRLVEWGFECGSHSMTHPDLTTLDSRACRRELIESRRILEEELRSPISTLAYPFGAYDERVRSIVAEAGYRSACSVRAGLSSQRDDLLGLHRVTILGQDSLPDFILRLLTARSIRESMRALARRHLSMTAYARVRTAWYRTAEARTSLWRRPRSGSGSA